MHVSGFGVWELAGGGSGGGALARGGVCISASVDMVVRGRKSPFA